MKRHHFVEIEDQPWCPAVLRDAATDFLQFAARAGNIYEPIVERLGRAIDRSGARRVVDLCSGGGGPWLFLRASLARAGHPVDVRLTDRYPNVAAFEASSGDGIAFERDPVDATDVPVALDGFRTLFASFHHFEPERAKTIIADAVAKRRGIAILEATERTPAGIVAILFSPLFVLLATPMIRPFRWSRLFWTYLVPAVPLLVLFDGVVSCLRTYTPDELRAFVAEHREYSWEIGQEKVGRGPASITYLIGVPTTEE